MGQWNTIPIFHLLSPGNLDRACLGSWTLFVDKPFDLGARSHTSHMPTGISMLITMFTIVYLLIHIPTRPYVFVFFSNALAICYCKNNTSEKNLMPFTQSKDATDLLLGKWLFQCEYIYRDLLEKIHCYSLQIWLSELDTEARGMGSKPTQLLHPELEEGSRGQHRRSHSHEGIYRKLRCKEIYKWKKALKEISVSQAAIKFWALMYQWLIIWTPVLRRDFRGLEQK